MTDADIDRLLKIPIRRISQYDIDKNRDAYDQTVKAIKQVTAKLKRLTETTIAYLRALLKTYGDRWPRRTEITTFDEVDVRSVARQNLKLSYDPDTGFFGTEAKGSQFEMQVSEYDRILLISKDGSYRVIGPEAKTLIPGRVMWAGVLDPEEGRRFTVVYRFDDRMAHAKKVHIKSFIRDKEYELIQNKKGRIDLLIEGDADAGVHVTFVPRKRQRVHEAVFDLADIDFQGTTARGRRIAPKPVAKIKKIARDVLESFQHGGAPSTDDGDASDDDQPGLFGADD